MAKESTIKVEELISKAKELQTFDIKETSEYTYITDDLVRKYAESVQTIPWYYEYSMMFILVGLLLTLLVSIVIYTRITEYRIKHALITVLVMLVTVAPSIFLYANYQVKLDTQKVGQEYIQISNDFNKQIKGESVIVKYGLDTINKVTKNKKGEDVADITLIKLNTKSSSFDELRYEGVVTGYIKGMEKEDVKAVDVYVVDEKYYPYIGSNVGEVKLVLNVGK